MLVFSRYLLDFCLFSAPLLTSPPGLSHFIFNTSISILDCGRQTDPAGLDGARAGDCRGIGGLG